MKKITFLTATWLLSFYSYSQYNLSGTVLDSLNKPLVGATVRILNSFRGIATDNNGSFKFTNLKQQEYLIEASFIGYETQQKQISNLSENTEIHFILQESKNTLDELIVTATRVEENSPIVHTNISYSEIEKNNLAQDVPVLLQNSVSMVSTSDAGAGVGYTSFRLRGSDATRINVTINSIPVNDAESQGVWWVNMPDFISSTENIQIQRGVGASTNGAGAFGGTVNLQTTTLKEKAYAEIASSAGSFNTQKYTFKTGTGLINNHFTFDARASKISSDGYIDRASSDLKSYYLSAGYYDKKTSLKIIQFSGKEITYQAWWGTPESRIKGNQDEMLTHAMNNGLDSAETENLINSGRTYNYYQYKNEIDHYTQDHFQLHFTHQINEYFSANVALHYTYGRGYYEQYRKKDEFSKYALPDVVIGNDTIKSSDFIRRRWLDNHFYGTVYNINYKNNLLSMTAGGGYNIYDGTHFGELIWAEFASNSKLNQRYYQSNALKTDLNHFLKIDYSLTDKWLLYADMQVRNIAYNTKGSDNDLSLIHIDTTFVFINPKGGISFQPNKKIRTYASVSVGNREPVRSDFIDNPKNKQPKHETLIDYEAGLNFNAKKISLQTNFYFMDYKNQLILTGELNDVGTPIRSNVNSSYRAGIELSGKILLSKKLNMNFNTTLSQNKIKKFTEIIYDYTNGFDVVENIYSNTDIAYSPNIIAAFGLDYSPIKSLTLAMQSKYVGNQFLDNTSNTKRILAPYYTTDARITYLLYAKKVKEISVSLMAYNIFNALYSSNGYTFSYIYGELITENFYYPQAGTNFMAGISVKF
ncbi:MAG: TonB-dependent receptor [Flavobacteriales bacterium]|nr:TonB-dependent receptor [Flavobacteriales bacterium]